MAFGGPAFRKFGGGTAPCGMAAVSFCGGGGCCFKTEHKYSRFVATSLKKNRIFENLLVVDVAQEDATELAAVAVEH